jgi:hypothetical protein
MNEHMIAMKTDSGLTVIDRREIVAMTRVEGGKDTLYGTMEIHMRSGTIFCTKTTSAIDSLWYDGEWGIDYQEEEEE